MREVLTSLPPWAWKAGAGVLLCAVVLWWWGQPRSFDECMIAQLRNGPRHIYAHVEKVCLSRFPALKASAADIDFTDLIAPERRPAAAAPDVPWAPGPAGLPPGFVVDPQPVSGTE